MRPLISFTTDFGWSVAPGICRGVMKRICPEAEMVDITHSVPHFDIESGAFTLLDSLPYFPPAIHVAVVDPGVGFRRRAVAVQTGRGDILIAPDNGLISLVLPALGGATAARSIESPRVILTPTSQTFHGRDIFCPAAAHLAAGMPLAELGPAVDPGDLIRLDIPEPSSDGHSVTGLLLRFDPFGSARTNIYRRHLQPLALRPGERVRLQAGERHLALPFVNTFSDVPVGEPCCLIDSSDRLCIAVNQGSAREQLGLAARTPLRIARGDG